MLSFSIRNALRAPTVTRTMARATPMARPAMMKFQRNYSDHHEETFEEFTTRYVITPQPSPSEY